MAANASVENIGAQRLQTVMERVLDDISSTALDRDGEKIVVHCCVERRLVLAALSSA